MADDLEHGARRTEASAPIGHLESFASLPARYSIADAIQVLSPRPTMAQLVALFDGRATYDTIRDWRTGRRGTPLWAIELLRDKIQARANHLALGAQRTAAIVPGPGLSAGARNLAAWHARNKEKARNAAGS